ncbi:MAG: chorismate mutase [Acidobacteriota bacterium]|nr:chorismate mutase [Acidobacteriota bacterium]
MNPVLSQHRSTIDQLDVELLRLINERARTVAEIARLKKEQSLPVSDEAREAAVLHALVERNQGPLRPAGVRRIFGAILAESRRLQHTLGTEAVCTK